MMRRVTRQQEVESPKRPPQQHGTGGWHGSRRAGTSSPDKPGLSASQFSILTSNFVNPQRGFTLIELLIVGLIIVLIATMAVPSIGPMLKSNQRAQAVNTLNGVLTTIQTGAEANATPAALRFERAFKTNEDGQMIDTNGLAINEPGFDIERIAWLDHQQIKYVLYATRQRGGDTDEQSVSFRKMVGTSAIKLPKGAWIAPGYSIDPVYLDSASTRSDPDHKFGLTDKNLAYAPEDDFYPGPGHKSATINRLDTFYVVFDQTGAITRFDYDQISYYDDTQLYGGIAPMVKHPDESARSLLIYDREKYEDLGTQDPDITAASRLGFLRDQCKPLFINRATGSIVEGDER